MSRSDPPQRGQRPKIQDLRGWWRSCGCGKTNRDFFLLFFPKRVLVYKVLDCRRMAVIQTRELGSSGPYAMLFCLDDLDRKA